MADTIKVSQGFPRDIVVRPDDGGVEFDLEVFSGGGDWPSFVQSIPEIGQPQEFWDGFNDTVVLTQRFRYGTDTAGFIYCLMHCGTASEMWVSTVDEGGLEKPLEYHADYKTQWNYHLGMKKGTSTHSDFAAATDVGLSEADAEVKKWIKEPAELPTDATTGPWKILPAFKKTKPGVEFFISPSPVVTEFKRCCTEYEALEIQPLFTVGTRMPPDNTHGISDGAWLIMSSRKTFDGVYWLVTVTYQWAKVWDVDLYPEQDRP